MTISHISRRCLALLALSFASSAAIAQTGYPNKPIRLIAPFAAGGAADTVARIVSSRLAGAFGQPLIIDNRSGASGAIGSAAVAAAAPDGYTLLINLGPPHQTVHLFSKSVTYNPVNDFTPISLIASAPQALVVPAQSPIKTTQEFLAAARANPAGLTYGTSGIGTSQHLAGLLLASSQKIKLTHVGYRGGSAALTDVLGGQTDAAIIVLSNVLPYIRDGKLRALGVLESRRAHSAPDIPTLAESGVRGFAIPETWVGVLGPAKLPGNVAQRIHADIDKVLRDGVIQAQLEKAGFEIRTATPGEFSRQIAESEKVYRSIVAAAGIAPE
jgi:tripartite-type tricarboxylate transporter receptor subunit TctC